MRIILLSALLSASASAQFLAAPPSVVQLVRTAGPVAMLQRPYAAAKASMEAIGLVGITGIPETWMVEAHNSFASIEDLDRKFSSLGPTHGAGDSAGLQQDGVLSDSRTMIAIYRPAWSYRPVDAVRLLPRARYYLITIYRIRPGGESDFGTLMELRRATSDVVNLDRPDLAYQVVAGAPAGTMVVIAPLTTLATMDDGRAPLPPSADGLAAARAKDAPKIASETEISREHLIFRVDPRISYVSDEFAELDPEFWRGERQD